MLTLAVESGSNAIDREALSRELGMPVLMANCVGPADTFIGAGGSAAWDSQGHLLASLDDHSEGLIVLDTRSASAITLPLAPYLA